MNFLFLYFIWLFVIMLLVVILVIYGFRQRRKEERERREKLETTKKSAGLKEDAQIHEKVSQKIVQEGIERKRKKAEEKEARAEGVKETLKQPSLLSTIILDAWQNRREIGGGSWATLLIEGKINKREKISIEMESEGSKEKIPNLVKISSAEIPQLKDCYSRSLDEFNREDKEKIENWILANYISSDKGTF